MTTGSPSGVAPPARPVPLPRATNGRPWRRATRTAAATSSADSGQHTATASPSATPASRAYRARARAARRSHAGTDRGAEIVEERVWDDVIAAAYRARTVSLTPMTLPRAVSGSRSRSPGKEKRQWQIDVTFLASHYRCIFGQGCQGVLTEPAPELVHGCCSYGAHASDKKDTPQDRAAGRRSSATTSGSSRSGA